MPLTSLIPCASASHRQDLALEASILLRKPFPGLGLGLKYRPAVDSKALGVVAAGLRAPSR